MVKKNLVNKNVIRALSIGLSLAMASQPLTAMAAEPADDAPVREPIADAPLAPEEQADDGQEDVKTTPIVMADPVVQTNVASAVAKDVTDNKVDPAIDKVDAIVADINEEETAADREVKSKLGEQAADVNAATYADAEKTEKITDKTAGIETALKDIVDAATDKKTGLDALKGEVNAEAGKATKAVESAEGAAKTADEKVEAADEQLTKSATDIKNATTIGAAQDAYDDAKGAVDEAGKELESATKTVAQARKDWEAAKTAYNTAYNNYTGLIGDLNEDLGAAADTAEAVEGELDGLAEKVQNREANSGISEEKLNYINELKDLKDAAEAAEAEYKKAGYGLVAALEANFEGRTGQVAWYEKDKKGNYNEELEVNEDGSYNLDKATYSDLFREIVRFYYAPQVLGGISGVDENFAVEWHRDSNYCEAFNYCIVSYTDKNTGEKATAYLNYKLANQNNSNAAYTGLVIYEKVEDIELDETDLSYLSAEEKAKLEAGEVATLSKDWYKRKSDKKAMSVKKIVDADGTVHYYGFYDSTEAGDEIVEAHDKEVDASKTERDAQGRVTKEVAVKVNAANETWEYRDGQLVKTVTQETETTTTTTTYTGKNIAAVSAETSNITSEDGDNGSKAAYAAEFNKVLGDLTNGQSIEIKVGDITKTITKNVAEDEEGKETVTYTVKVGESEETKAAGFVTKDNAAEFGYKVDSKTKTTGYTVSVTYGSETGTDSRTVKGDGADLAGYTLADAAAATEYGIQYAAQWTALETQYGAKDLVHNIKFLGITTSELEKDHYTDEVFMGVEVFGHKVGKNVTRYNSDWSQTLTANFVKVSKMTVDAGRLNMWLTGGKSEEEAAKALLKAENKEYVDTVKIFDGINGKFTIYYYQNQRTENVTIAGDNKSVLTDAAIRENLNITDSNVKIAYNADNATTNTRTTYGYQKLDYIVITKAVVTTTTTATRTTTSDTVSLWKDDNYISGNAVTTKEDNQYIVKAALSEKDPVTKRGLNGQTVPASQDNGALSREVANANAIIDKYNAVIDDIEVAAKDVIDAKAEVTALKERIKAIKFSADPNLQTLAGLEARLEAAEKKLADAKTKKAELDKKLADLGTQLAGKIAELTPPTTDEGGTDTVTTGDVTTTDVLAGPGTVAGGVVTGGPAAGGGAAGGAGADGAAEAAGDGLTDIGPIQLAQSAGLDAPTSENKDFGIQKAPLAAAPINEETIGWWWLLIIAVLGGSGYAMYKKFQAKKEEKADK